MSTIDNLDIEIKSSASQASTGIDMLVGSLNRLKGVSPSKTGLGTLANQLNRLNTALSSMTGVSKLYSLTNSLKNLSSVEKLTGLQSATKQLSKLPQIASDLEKTDIDKFAKKIKEVTNAIKPLATEMEKVSNGFSALPTKIQRIIQSNEKLANSNKKASKSYGILGTGIKGWEARLGTTIIKAKMIGNVIGEWITKSNEYVENLNLFTVSLGQYADEAKDYAEQVGELMGIDPSEWLRAQGIFNTLATGFGIASDKASIMSKNLTQLSYDISSLYNIKVQDAMTKLQSAFSGELEPVRRLGYDLSQTKLQAIASANGIDILVSDMTQAEKSMLRYYALMTQVTVAQGDMARTLNAPANQLRIFSAQIEQAKRALGNIFIPALNAVLPYLIAFVKLIRAIANEIAMLFGFELPEIDYSDVNNLGSGIDKNFDDATKSANKFKNAVMGFDELNILNQDAGEGLSDSLNGLRFDLDIPEYDFLKGLTESKASQIYKKMEGYIKPVLNLFEGFADGVTTAFELINTLDDTFLLGWLSDIGEWMKNNPNTLWLIGHQLGFIATALLGWKAIKGLATLFGLPTMFGKLAEGVRLAWVVNAGYALPSFVAFGLVIGGIGLLILSLYSAFELLKTIIDIKNGEITGWEAFRELIGNSAMTLGAFGTAMVLFGKVALGTVMGILSVGLLAIGLMLTNWEDFAFGAQIAFAYLAKFVVATLWSISNIFGSGLLTIVTGIKEAILAVLWVLAKAAENRINGVISGVGTLLKWVDEIAGTNLSSKIKEVDFTSGIEEKMKEIGEDFSNKITESGDSIKEAWSYDVWESDYLKKAEDMYVTNLMSKGGEADTSGIESIASDLRETFESFRQGNEDSKAQLENLEIQQEELKKQMEQNSIQQQTDASTANALNEEIKGLQEEIKNQQIQTNEINSTELPKISEYMNSLDNTASETLNVQDTGLSKILNAIRYLQNTIASKLDAVEDACRDIRINVTKVYGGEGYATGGFPTTGQMFYARENGIPELVGRIGSRTAVANNDQITQGIATAVYNAMVSANQGGDNSFNIYLDGRQINASVEKVKKEKGASIMTGGLRFG